MSKKVEAVRFDRVSSDDQRDGYSLDAQRENGIRCANENNLKIVREWSVSESASKEEDRKEFFEMIEFVKANQVKAVIFDKVDRACRGKKSEVLIDELMEKHGVRFYFTRDNLVIDRNSAPTDKFRFGLFAAVAKLYIDNLKVEIRKGIDAKRKAGVWSGKAPFGYRNTEINGRKAIAKDDQEFIAGKEVFQLYATGNYGHEELANLIRKRVPERSDVTKRLVENMLSNPFYYGAMKIKGEVFRASHEPMITKELFDSCQKIRGIRATDSRSKRKGFIPKPLMGLFKCGECNHNVTGESQKKSSGRVFIYYRCANHKCPQYKKRVNQNDLFALLKSAFEPFKKWTPKATKAFTDTIHTSLDDLDLYTQKMTGELAAARIQLKKRIEQLNDYRSSGALSDREYEAAVQIPMKLLGDKTAEIQAYQEADLATFQNACKVIQLFQKAYDYIQIDGNELEKVKLIKSVLSNLSLKDRTIEFDYVKPLDVVLDLTTVPVWWRRRESNPRP